MKLLPKEFYERDPAVVACELLGKVLVRKLEGEILSGKVVETEAYYGEEDPASKAYKGEKRFNQLMFCPAGKLFIYMVHGNWLLNIVSHPEGGVGAVLIRALEPISGVETMIKNRGVKKLECLTSGPGRLTKALAVTNELNGEDVTSENSRLTVAEGMPESFQIASTHRIGVKFDLPQPLRFYIKGNRHVSKG
ncbi:MAG: DNA-3-methyladenine glycosylase [Candidatus Bathyarchaeia archaeon]